MSITTVSTKDTLQASLVVVGAAQAWVKAEPWRLGEDRGLAGFIYDMLVDNPETEPFMGAVKVLGDGVNVASLTAAVKAALDKVQ